MASNSEDDDDDDASNDADGDAGSTDLLDTLPFVTHDKKGK